MRQVIPLLILCVFISGSIPSAANARPVSNYVGSNNHKKYPFIFTFACPLSGNNPIQKNAQSFFCCASGFLTSVWVRRHARARPRVRTIGDAAV